MRKDAPRSHRIAASVILLAFFEAATYALVRDHNMELGLVGVMENLKGVVAVNLAIAGFVFLGGLFLWALGTLIGGKDNGSGK